MEVTRPVESKRNRENENETRVKVSRRVEIWKTRGRHGNGSGIMASEIWRAEAQTGTRRRNDAAARQEQAWKGVRRL